MRFLADENISPSIVTKIRQLKIDIIGLSEKERGLRNSKLLLKAIDENRILITIDKGFGELVFKKKLLPQGVILLRLKKESFKNVLHFLSKFFLKYQSNLNFLNGKFFIVSEKGIKFRKI